jgi:hypothetical protein
MATSCTMHTEGDNSGSSGNSFNVQHSQVTGMVEVEVNLRPTVG